MTEPGLKPEMVNEALGDFGAVETVRWNRVKVAVPIDKLHPFYTGIRSYEDLPTVLCEQIAHFFQHYKDLEKGKWVRGLRWEGPAEAERLVSEAIERAGARA